MPTEKDFRPVFDKLKTILSPYAPSLKTLHDTDSSYVLITAHILPNKSPLYFGHIEIKKNYVSFHLMPVYVRPELLEDISPTLKKRMQGKSCFNFAKLDEDLFGELAALTQRGFAMYQAVGYVE